MAHRWELDALRGLMLVLMTVTHLPTRFSDPLGQPFGFVSAAEGFVMLSAYMAGLVYTQRERRHGEDEMRGAFWKRAFKIWLAQAALLLFAFTVVALLGAIENEAAVNDLLAFYLERPLTAFVGGLLLIYSPPLLDILPMYILFMLASPLLLLHGLRQGWLGIMIASIGLWLAAQFDAGAAIYNVAVAHTPLPVPLRETGAFSMLAWQFLWVFGLWLGSSHAVGAGGERFPRWMIGAAIVIAAVGLVWRHAVGQVPFPGQPALDPLLDKWTLGPLRLIDFFALVVLAMHFGPWLKAHLSRLRVLEVLGAAALPVFCAHLMLVLVVLAMLGGVDDQRSWWLDAVVVTGTLVALYAVALASAEVDRQAAAARERLKALKARRSRPVVAAAGAGRSPSSTARTPPG